MLESFKIFLENRFDDRYNCRMIVYEHETDLMSFVAAFGEPEFLEHVIDTTNDNLSQSMSDQAWKHSNYEIFLLLVKPQCTVFTRFQIATNQQCTLEKENNKNQHTAKNCTMQLKKTRLRLRNTSLISIKL